MEEILKPLEKYIEEVAKFVSKTGHDIELNIKIKCTKSGVLITCDNVQILALYNEQEDKWYKVELDINKEQDISTETTVDSITDLF